MNLYIARRSSTGSLLKPVGCVVCIGCIGCVVCVVCVDCVLEEFVGVVMATADRPIVREFTANDGLRFVATGCTQ